MTSASIDKCTSIGDLLQNRKKTWEFLGRDTALTPQVLPRAFA